MMNVGSGDFAESGQRYLPMFVKLGGLTPTDRVLEVGSGIGHMAVALSGYLSHAGSYDGFDVVGQGIRWCQAAITPRFPNFRFHHADVRNTEYNPRGKIRPADFVFPYGDGAFDFVLLTSVFTHMKLEDIGGYLQEIRRVLRVDGCCFSTFFLTTSPRIAGAGPGMKRFAHEVGQSLTIDRRSPDKALAHPETTVRALYDRHALTIQEPIHYGDWPATRSLQGSQDVIVARRRA
jgi:ubiquinone/menaquinone biosynthesis C-methylase UbiE